MENRKNIPQVSIVEASAGSGKTYALARRYIELLFGSADEKEALKNILAITFSNKASLEMKERILSLLKKIALEQYGNEEQKRELLELLGMPAERASKTAFQAIEEIIKNYNFFQVQTIDSFINAILSGCAFRLGLSANFQIKTRPEDHLVYGLDSLLEKAQSDAELRKLFLEFLHQYLRLENKTGWMPKKDILKVIERLYRNVNVFGTGFFLPSGSFSDVSALKRSILKNLKKLEKEMPEGTHANFSKKLQEFLAENTETFSLADLSDFFAREEFPAGSKADIRPSLGRLWQELRKQIRECSELEAVLVFKAYVGIFLKVFEDFRQIAQQEDVMYLDELNSQAHVLFDEKKITVPELYYRIAMRLKHYLIDEFQDTSLLQWGNLSGMVKEALSVGGSIFYVGDKKQAIYRFRGGEVSLFDSLKREFSDFNPKVEYLRNNYRSRPRIVEFTNKIFGEENLKNFFLRLREGKTKVSLSAEDERFILDVFSQAPQLCRSIDGGQGWVRLSVIESESADEKEERVKERLYGVMEGLKQRNMPLSDCAILVRENDEVELVSEWLLEKGLPVESDKTLDMRNNGLIKELVSFLAFLQSPADNLSFVSFIMGRMFLSASGLDEKKAHDFVFSQRQDRRARTRHYYYSEFRRQFPEAWEGFIEEFFRNVGYMPLYELVVSIFRKYRCLERFPDHEGFFLRFLELIKEQEQDNGHLSSFLEFFGQEGAEPFYVHGSRAEAVRVLTIHKAKGLGFRVVVLPFLEMSVRVAGTLTSVSGGKMSLVRLSEKARKFSPFLESLYCEEYRRCFIDELDNMYVALTRAREEMHIFLPKNNRRGRNMAALLIGGESFETGEPSAVSVREQEKGAEEIGPASYQDWIQYLKEEFVDSRLIMKRRALLKGEVCHKILSHITDLGAQKPGKALEAALAKAEAAYPSFEDLEACRKQVSKLINSPSCRKFFYPEKKQLFNERECFDRSGRPRRLDRVMVDERECWIIDYKSSDEEKEAGRLQVKEYMGIVSDIYPDRKIKGFLVYIDTCEYEEVRGV